jgi:3-methyladenine DNA glycosylase AlkC
LDYKRTIEILDNLYFDKSRYVTRSVANHLNDISKIDGDLVVDVLEKWKNKLKG